METPQIEELITLATNSFDSWADKAQQDGVDLSERIDRLLPLLIKLTDPKVMDLVEKTVEKHETINQLLDMGEEIPNLVSTGANTFDALIARLQEQNIDIDARVQHLLTIMDILTNENVMRFMQFFNHHVERFLHLGEIFVDADTFNSKFAAFLEDATKSLVQTTDCPPAPVKGVFGMLKVLKDRDVSRAVGFGVRFAKKFGQTLNAKSN